MNIILCLNFSPNNSKDVSYVFRSEQIPHFSSRWTPSSSRRHRTKHLHRKQLHRLTMGTLSCRPRCSVLHWFQLHVISALLLTGTLLDAPLLPKEYRNAYDLQLYWDFFIVCCSVLFCPVLFFSVTKVALVDIVNKNTTIDRLKVYILHFFSGNKHNLSVLMCRLFLSHWRSCAACGH